jgi:hypothetical protein
MARGPLYEQDYRPQFSGHETFPFRYGWLKKAFDTVRSSSKKDSKTLFTRPEAIADFGVGKNMVSSIRHWATVMGVISEAGADGSITTTDFGELIFAPRGLDPYLEHASTLWLLHWKLAANPKKTTWYYAFNLYPNRVFDRPTLTGYLAKIAEELDWQRASIATIKRDVECFVRTYVPKRISRKFGFEDSLECPLSELGLIKSAGGRDGFQFVVGPKRSLGMGVFLYALEEFWGEDKPNTLSIEAIAHEQGSPGRVFQLDESDLIHRFSNIENLSNDNFRWSETAGLKQLIRTRETGSNLIKHDYLKLDYQKAREAKTA